jgi:hypothetical protein
MARMLVPPSWDAADMVMPWMSTTRPQRYCRQRGGTITV